eukprot:Rhum_TRINITY_DN25081_c0_g2::Rhum_TRINITY_DN25081_c0_g2_i1::g.181124::m.181124
MCSRASSMLHAKTPASSSHVTIRPSSRTLNSRKLAGVRVPDMGGGGLSRSQRLRCVAPANAGVVTETVGGSSEVRKGREGKEGRREGLPRAPGSAQPVVLASFARERRWTKRAEMRCVWLLAAVGLRGTEGNREVCIQVVVDVVLPKPALKNLPNRSEAGAATSQNNMKFLLACQRGLQHVVDGHKRLVNQVFARLLENVIRNCRSPPGGVDLCLPLRRQQSLSVLDGLHQSSGVARLQRGKRFAFGHHACGEAAVEVGAAQLRVAGRGDDQEGVCVTLKTKKGDVECAASHVVHEDVGHGAVRSEEAVRRRCCDRLFHQADHREACLLAGAVRRRTLVAVEAHGDAHCGSVELKPELVLPVAGCLFGLLLQLRQDRSSDVFG